MFGKRDADPCAVVGGLLEERARTARKSETTITYGELVELLGLPKLGPDWHNHPLSEILGKLNDEDHCDNRPFRSVLVVNAKTHKSGSSFFWAVSHLRYGDTPIPAKLQSDYWKLEQELLLKYWRSGRAE